MLCVGKEVFKNVQVLSTIALFLHSFNLSLYRPVAWRACRSCYRNSSAVKFLYALAMTILYIKLLELFKK